MCLEVFRWKFPLFSFNVNVRENGESIFLVKLIDSTLIKKSVGFAYGSKTKNLTKDELVHS